jgi:hypothetical protein
MQQFQSIPASLGSLWFKDQPSTLGPYVVDAIDNTILLERKGKNLAAKFDATDAHDGLGMCYLPPFSYLVP